MRKFSGLKRTIQEKAMALAIGHNLTIISETGNTTLWYFWNFKHPRHLESLVFGDNFA